MAWRTIRGRKVRIRSRGSQHKSPRHHSPKSKDGLRFIFGRTRTPEEHLAHEKEVAEKRELKARLKAIRRESKARAAAYKKIGKERAKEERLRVLRAGYEQE